MKTYPLYLLLLLLCCACQKEEISTYQSDRYLFFPDSTRGLDTASFSFSHYPGQDSRDIPFYVALIGEPAEKALEFELTVVDSLTTADPLDYDFPDRLLFPARTTLTTIHIRCKNVRPELSRQRVRLVFRIAENENFKAGLYNHQTIQITFDNIKSKPLWWTGDLENLILGKYSEKKFEHFVIATGVSDLSGISLSEARALTMEFKVYLLHNNIMEADNMTPMIEGVPCY